MTGSLSSISRKCRLLLLLEQFISDAKRQQYHPCRMWMLWYLIHVVVSCGHPPFVWLTVEICRKKTIYHTKTKGQCIAAECYTNCICQLLFCYLSFKKKQTTVLSNWLPGLAHPGHCTLTNAVCVARLVCDTVMPFAWRATARYQCPVLAHDKLYPQS